MLVLTRKENDKIVFPTLSVAVEVLRVQGNKARLGIHAPEEIPVLREEIADLKAIEFTGDQESISRKLATLAHQVRQQLTSASDVLNTLHQHLDDDPEGQQLVLDVFQELRTLEEASGDTLEARQESRHSDPRALLVEDDENQRQLLASYLQMAGIEVTTASDGFEAFDYLSLHQRPDVVLLDMNMPRCDGPSFVKRVRHEGQLADMKIFAVSGTQPSQLGVVTGPQGIDRWFPKPVDAEQLAEEVKREFAEIRLAV